MEADITKPALRLALPNRLKPIIHIKIIIKVIAKLLVQLIRLWAGVVDVVVDMMLF